MSRNQDLICSVPIEVCLQLQTLACQSGGTWLEQAWQHQTCSKIKYACAKSTPLQEDRAHHVLPAGFHHQGDDTCRVGIV